MSVKKIIAIAVLIVGLAIAYTIIFVFPYDQASQSRVQSLWQKKSPQEIQEQLNICLNEVSNKLKNINLKNLSTEEIKKTLNDNEKEKSGCIEKYK